MTSELKPGKLASILITPTQNGWEVRPCYVFDDCFPVYEVTQVKNMDEVVERLQKIKDTQQDFSELMERKYRKKEGK